MTSPRSLLLALMAVGAAAFVAPAIAGASTFCVHAPAGTSCNDTQPDLQSALNAAQKSFGPDTVLLGSPGAPEAGPFVYPTGIITAEDTVAIKGVGPVRPVLSSPGAATVLKLIAGSLEGVDVQLPNAAGSVGIETAIATLRDVRVTGPGAQLAGAMGIHGTGDLTLDNVEVTGTGATGVLLSDGTVDASRLRITDVANGLGADANAHVQLTGSKITGRDAALLTLGTTDVSASVLQSTAPGSAGVTPSGGAVTLDHVTVVHRGPVDGTDAALNIHPSEFNGEVTLNAVVLAGYTRGIRRDTTEGGFHFPITIRDSVWDSSHDVLVPDPNAGPFDELGAAHIDPALVDLAGGDFRLRGSSAAVDRDTRTNLRYEDVNGGGLVDGDANGVVQADAGAFEYRRGAPAIDTAQVPESGATGQALAFAATASDPDGDVVKLAWDFGDGSVGVGAQATHTYGAVGIHTVTLYATDDVGLTATRTFSVAVSAPAAGGGTGGAGGGDVIAPKLSKVSLSKSRLSKSRLRARSAKAPALRFTLSERATVRITVGGVKVVKTVSAGRHSIGLTKALRRAKALRLGRVAVKITATDAAGNRSAARTVKLRIVA